MNRIIPTLLACASLLGGGAPAADADAAPEFTHRRPADWLNSGPLTLASLRGRVVLVEFWTTDCVNCRRTLPWIKAAYLRHRDAGLVVIGVHSPEFERERGADNVRAAVKRFGIEYAVMLDDDFSYWNALGNRYWPAFYLIDRQGRVAATAFGELQDGTARGAGFERQIRRLLDARD